MNGKQKKPRRRWLRRIEIGLLACGFALLAFWGVAELAGILASRKALRDFEDSPVQDQRGGSAAIATALSPPNENGASADGSVSAGDRPRTLAVLRIPKIAMEVPVADGTDSLTLNYAVGRISGTARPGEAGNIGIAGHRDTFFRGLKDLSVGDRLELESRSGRATYVVNRIRIVGPENVAVLKPGTVPTLTLVTCYPFYFVGNAPKRYIVSATLAQEAHQGARAAVSANHSVSIQ
ncbi:MAG TPA: class D sortase [Candidatus Sulfotelmatobacter sp.]|nr:class D sortase [Candidatus Sulfotelmatobacter sp.]